MQNSPAPRSARNERVDAYWRENKRLIFTLLAIWVVASMIHPLFAKQLNSITILTGFPLGYWLASQGSITLFVILIFIYAFQMNSLDRKYGFEEQEEE
jgi:putative solute:sodium symporter small subunit